jgi:hypothetical protein
MNKVKVNEGRIVPPGLVFILLLIFAPYFDGALSSMTRHKASSLKLPQPWPNQGEDSAFSLNP